MDAIDIGGILVAIIAALGAWAAQRSAAKAASAGSRLDAEKEAYERARKMDVETIQRQSAEILELRKMLAAANDEIRRLKLRMTKLEDISPELEELLRQRLEEASHDDQKPEGL